jgi:hypothetical protein
MEQVLSYYGNEKVALSTAPKGIMSREIQTRIGAYAASEKSIGERWKSFGSSPFSSLDAQTSSEIRFGIR